MVVVLWRARLGWACSCTICLQPLREYCPALLLLIMGVVTPEAAPYGTDSALTIASQVRVVMSFRHSISYLHTLFPCQCLDGMYGGAKSLMIGSSKSLKWNGGAWISSAYKARLACFALTGRFAADVWPVNLARSSLVSLSCSVGHRSSCFCA